MPDPHAFYERLNKRSAALLARVEKELARSAPATAAAGTALVGGWTKMGAEIETFLEAVFGWLCAREGRDPREEIRIALPQARNGTVTAGQLARIVGDFGREPGARANEVATVCRDLAGHGSKLRQLIEVRNKVVHERDGLPNHATAKATLEPVAQLLRTYRKQAGF